jgi:Uma2 family endonuclease
MQARTLISVEEYLETVYRPDCEYVDGALLERNLGEIQHSDLQRALIEFFAPYRKTHGLKAFPEQRVQVSARRFRVPDVSVVRLPLSDTRIITQPPFLCIEILSPRDWMLEMEERINDYLRFGVPYVWVLDPYSHRAFAYTTEGRHEPPDGILRTSNPEITLSVADLFD